MSDKLLVSGCGISWSGQKRRTYVNVLQSMGCNVVDVSGPGVSNQYIFNSAIKAITQDPDINKVLIQTTFLGKLDVDITNQEQLDELVQADPVRNFKHNGIWPSSNSDFHESKRLYNKWLVSPRLEMDDLIGRMITFNSFCRQHGIQKILFVAGYPLEFDKWQNGQLSNLYFLQLFNHSDTQSGHTPPLDRHIDIAVTVSGFLDLDCHLKVGHAQRQYDRWRSSHYVLK